MATSSDHTAESTLENQRVDNNQEGGQQREAMEFDVVIVGGGASRPPVD
jgi:hypothetical protein